MICWLAVDFQDDVPAPKSVKDLLDLLSPTRREQTNVFQSDEAVALQLFSFLFAFTQIGHQLRKGMCVALWFSISCVVVFDASFPHCHDPFVTAFAAYTDLVRQGCPWNFDVSFGSRLEEGAHASNM